MYQAILFDLDDTLISLRGCEAEALFSTLRLAGLGDALADDAANVAEIYARISSQYWARHSREALAREQVIEQSLRDLLRQLRLDVTQSAQLAERYWTEFCRSTALNPGAVDVLERLQARYRLGMITNGYTDSQRGRLNATGLTRYFDPILISEEVGVAKPDAAIFEMALSLLDLGCDEVLYVGDSISHDREGCLRTGIDFCHFCPGRVDNNSLPVVKFRIANLGALLPILLPE